MPTDVNVGGTWKQITGGMASIKVSGAWKQLLGGWYKTGGSWYKFYDGAVCTDAPTISGTTTNFYNTTCTTNLDFLKLEFIINLNNPLPGNCYIRYEGNTGAGWYLIGEVKSTTQYIDTGCCMGCTGGTACSGAALQMRAKIKCYVSATSVYTDCTDWSYSTDYGAWSGRNGKTATCLA